MIEPLEPAAIDEARALLAAACVWDRAAEVATEKLFEPAPAGPAVAWAAREGGELVGVAAATGNRVRLVAVAPAARRRGIGGALLDHVEVAAARAGVAALRTLDLPGNYLAPGIDERNTLALGWLQRRGWVHKADNANLIVAVRGNPRVSEARAAELAERAAVAGYQVRRAVAADGPALTAAIDAEFGMAWPFEVTRALERGGVHVATLDGAWAAFAAHDGNNAGLGWFGPAGTWPAHRGRGLGEAVLLACLVEVAVAHEVCEVAWVGPREFYQRSAGVAGERRFTVLTKELAIK